MYTLGSCLPSRVRHRAPHTRSKQPSVIACPKAGAEFASLSSELLGFLRGAIGRLLISFLPSENSRGLDSVSVNKCFVHSPRKQTCFLTHLWLLETLFFTLLGRLQIFLSLALEIGQNISLFTFCAICAKIGRRKRLAF